MKKNVWEMNTQNAIQAALTVPSADGDLIRNGEAVYAYDHGDYDKCRITLKVAADRIEVNQDQPCGFGTGVDASGTYVKISSEIPKMRTSAVAERL